MIRVCQGTSFVLLGTLRISPMWLIAGARRSVHLFFRFSPRESLMSGIGYRAS